MFNTQYYMKLSRLNDWIEINICFFYDDSLPYNIRTDI